MQHNHITQGSPEWFDVKRGKISASGMADLTAKTKTGWGASRANYAAKIIVERLTGLTADSFSNAAMQFGTDNEPQARAAYQFFADADVAQVGFVDHPTIPMAGCSPDGLVGADGMIEIKVPNTATHIETLLGAAIDEKYIKQMQFQMACTGRKWCDYVSFDPRMPVGLQLKIQRVNRDDVMIASLEKDALIFLCEIDDKVAQLNALAEADSVPEKTQYIAV